MNRLENAIPAGIIMLIGLWVGYVSATQQPSEAFLFPRLISGIFVVLSVWVFVSTLIGQQPSTPTIPKATWMKILPGLIVAIVFVFWAAKGLGFYTAASVAAFVLFTLYDPAPMGDWRAWVKRLLITAVFMAVMYGLFAGLLNVFTPREVFF